MTGKRVDYDQLAAGYEERYRVNPLSGVAAALSSLARAGHPRRIVEVGCGTGHWLDVLQGEAAVVEGIDASFGMLRQAHARGLAGLLAAGTAVSLPLQKDSVDLLFVVNAVHHFGDFEAFAREAARVVAPSGAIAIVGVHPLEFCDKWYPYEYFEGNYAADIERFPSRSDQVGALEHAGFVEFQESTVDGVEDTWMGEEVLADPFLKRKSNSSLAQLSEEVYSAGLAKIRAAIDEGGPEGRDQTFRRALDFEMLHGRIGR